MEKTITIKHVSDEDAEFFVVITYEDWIGIIHSTTLAASITTVNRLSH